jgi:hypothetical protein
LPRASFLAVEKRCAMPPKTRRHAAALSNFEIAKLIGSLRIDQAMYKPSRSGGTEQQLLGEISANLSQFGKIPASKAEDFESWVGFALNNCWKDTTAHKRHALNDVIVDVRNKTTGLCRQLEKLRQHLEQPINRSRTDEIAGVIEKLSTLTDHLRPLAPRKPGKPRRELSTFVLVLQLGVKKCNGRLTVDKRSHKGTLIQALDWLRAYCQTKPECAWVAKLIPPPGRHPVSTYERLLRTVAAQVHEEIEIVFDPAHFRHLRSRRKQVTQMVPEPFVFEQTNLLSPKLKPK